VDLDALVSRLPPGPKGKQNFFRLWREEDSAAHGKSRTGFGFRPLAAYFPKT